MIHFDIAWRSVIKAVTWKVIATILTIAVTYYYTGEVGDSIKVGVTVFVVGIVFFYIHERAWNRIHWGKKSKHPGEPQVG